MMYCTVCVCMCLCVRMYPYMLEWSKTRLFPTVVCTGTHSGVDSVTVTFTSWPWGKKEMVTLTAWTIKEGVVMVVLEQGTMDQGIVADMDFV